MSRRYPHGDENSQSPDAGVRWDDGPGYTNSAGPGLGHERNPYAPGARTRPLESSRSKTARYIPRPSSASERDNRRGWGNENGTSDPYRRRVHHARRGSPSPRREREEDEGRRGDRGSRSANRSRHDDGRQPPPEHRGRHRPPSPAAARTGPPRAASASSAPFFSGSRRDNSPAERHHSHRQNQPRSPSPRAPSAPPHPPRRRYRSPSPRQSGRRWDNDPRQRPSTSRSRTTKDKVEAAGGLAAATTLLSNPRFQKAAAAALQAGSAEAFQLRRSPGSWSGEKGARVATAALGAAAMGAFKGGGDRGGSGGDDGGGRSSSRRGGGGSGKVSQSIKSALGGLLVEQIAGGGGHGGGSGGRRRDKGRR